MLEIIYLCLLCVMVYLLYDGIVLILEIITISQYYQIPMTKVVDAMYDNGITIPTNIINEKDVI